MAKVALGELKSLAEEVLARLPEKTDRATVVALVGELGAGKTTFVQTLAKALGVGETVQSPTYVLMKSYDIHHRHFAKLVHIDAYRLEGAEEFAALKPNTFLRDPKTLVCIEWPERVEGALPTPDLVLKFSADARSNEERYIELTS